MLAAGAQVRARAVAEVYASRDSPVATGTSQNQEKPSLHRVR